MRAGHVSSRQVRRSVVQLRHDGSYEHRQSLPPTIVSVPQGLTAIDADGKVLPIVALRVDYNPAAPADYGEPATKITPLYLAEGGSIGAVFNEATIGLSEAWTPASFVGYIETALSMDDPGPFR